MGSHNFQLYYRQLRAISDVTEISFTVDLYFIKK